MTDTGKKITTLLFVAILSAGTLLAAPNSAMACSGCGCTAAETSATINRIITEHNSTRRFITREFQNHQNWVFGANSRYRGRHDSFFELHMLPALMMMTEQLVTNGMNQMFALGAFFDARQQLQTQQVFQKKAAEAHRDYHPSFDMCVVGTTARGLASADHNGEFTSFVLSQRSQDRQIGIYSASAAHSAAMDRDGRIRQVIARYCDTANNNSGLDDLCPSKADPATVNRDIDYTRTVDMNRTLNIDFTNPAQTADEIDVMALASNLFSYEVLDRPGLTSGEMESSEGPYMAMRSVVAKRSVAENSFNAIIGLKAAGTETSEKTIMFTQKVLEQFGVTNQDDRLRLLGGTQDNGYNPAKRPSYFAQMEVLAQKLYQDPEFYSNLYDKPANVLRREVAMQAVNLMLERDLYKNELRSEMVMSVWLEMELMKYQNDIQSRMNAMKERHEAN